MKRLTLILFLFPFILNAESILYSSDKVSVQPSFKGGEKALYDFINKHASYDACYATSNGDYPPITISMIIDSTGNASNLNYVEEIGTIYEKKVMDALQHMPKWNPARINGKPVNSSITLKIKYTIPGSKVYAEEHGTWKSEDIVKKEDTNIQEFHFKPQTYRYKTNQLSQTNLFVLIAEFIAVLCSLMLAVLPAVLIIMLIYYMRKQKSINFSEMAKYFIFGIIIILPAIAIEKIFDFENFKTWKEIIIYAFIIVGLTEESVKFFILRTVAFKNENFKEPYDGIVYAVLISMGFATAENIYYTYLGGSPLALIRMFTAVPAHAAFAVLMGFFTGLAKVRRFRVFYMTTGLLIAVFFHGIYDFFLMQNDHPRLKILTLFFLIVSIYLSARAIKIGRRYKIVDTADEARTYESEYTKDGL